MCGASALGGTCTSRQPQPGRSGSRTSRLRTTNDGRTLSRATWSTRSASLASATPQTLPARLSWSSTPTTRSPPSTARDARSWASSVLWVRLSAGSSCLRSTQWDSSSSPPAAASTTSDHAVGVHRPFCGLRYALLGRCSVMGFFLHHQVLSSRQGAGDAWAIGSRPAGLPALGPPDLNRRPRRGPSRTLEGRRPARSRRWTGELGLEVGKPAVLEAQVRACRLKPLLQGPVVVGELPNPLL